MCYWSDSTDLGLTVTLRSVLELCEYLWNEIGLEYVMLSRLNQDALEVKNFYP